MKPFTTRLDAVLTLRRRQEHLALERYARAMLASRQALAALAEVQREAQALARERNAHMATGVKAAQFAQWEGFSTTLQGKKTLAERAVAEATRSLNQNSREMLRTRQQREVVEKWIGRRRQRYDLFLLQADQKAMDELAQRSRLAPKTPRPALPTSAPW